MKTLIEFQAPFQELCRKILLLPLPLEIRSDIAQFIQTIQATGENIAANDSTTLALNRRGEQWFVPNEQVKSVAKIDLYDVRQANMVYGPNVVDRELRRLSCKLRQVFHNPISDFIRRATGSDEFKIVSIEKSVTHLAHLIQQLHNDDRSETLIPWDFGVGTTEEQADMDLREKRKQLRPSIIRQPAMNNLLEMPGGDPLLKNVVPTLIEFRQPYHLLAAWLRQYSLPHNALQAVVEGIYNLQVHVEDEITSDDLTGVLNSIGQQWYIEEQAVKINSVALTDMANMHECNVLHGERAVDRDLQRFALVLQDTFKGKDGFWILRSQKAGDEFEILSSKASLEQLGSMMEQLHQEDIHKGLLAWYYGVGHNKTEASTKLNAYQNFTARIPPMLFIRRTNTEAQNILSYYLITKPEGEDHEYFVKLAERVARACGGMPITDLHCTLQSVDGNVNLPDLCKEIRDYSQTIDVFDIEFSHTARINVDNLSSRIWLMAEKTDVLKGIYQKISYIAQKMELESYPYPVGEWRPHMKLVYLPVGTPPLQADPAFGLSMNRRIRVKSLELTCLIGTEKWETVDEFSIGHL